MIVEVAAAVILRADGAFLLAKRPAGKVYAGWWEFPGGKVEEGEPAEAALVRELQEELGIDVKNAWPWLTRVFTYEHATVRLNFFRVTVWTGEPHGREGQELAWQRLDETLLSPMLPANAPILASLALPAEYAVSAVDSLGEAEYLRRLESRLKGGLRLVQLREKHLSPHQLVALAAKVCALAHHYGARVLVNGDVALAREAGADGIHFPAQALMRLNARPQGLLVGASCHDENELAQGMRLELDFAVLGPVKPTASHPGAQALGWDRFAQLARGATLPVYAIGGLAPLDLGPARRSGAHGIAMIRGAWPAP
ncbi:MAG: Nudix family hydrolase [Betaproteobacteria bacterium]